VKPLDFVNYARKFFVALVAALAELAVVLSDGTVTTSEWILVAIAFAGALGVYQVANKQV
jgi:hypothetical protein